jgi:hypothetical protein
VETEQNEWLSCFFLYINNTTTAGASLAVFSSKKKEQNVKSNHKECIAQKVVLLQHK